MNPFFSIIIPTLGKLDQLSRAIKSVLDQTYQNFEIITIDSGPEEDSLPIVKNFNDPKIKYFNTSSGDPRLNWDFGFRKSTGEYIIWMDDDNYLLPHELDELAKIIKQFNPDIVTGEHVHYRGLLHPIKSARNQLIIRGGMFSYETKKVDKNEIIRRIMDIPRKTNQKYISVGFSHTAVKKSLAERLINRIGEINFGATGSHALRVGLLALADEVYHIDKPLEIVAQFGTSMSDVWPKLNSKIKRKEFEFKLSPVKANTYANYRNENYLLLNRALPRELAEFPIDQKYFFSTYMRELVFLKQSWKDIFKYWLELLKVIKSSRDQAVKSLYWKIYLHLIKALAVKFTRVTGVFTIFQQLLENIRKSKKNQIIIPLNSYGVKNIRDCAQKMPEIIEKELKIPYSRFSGLY